jgi:hypothetical protein
VKSKEPKVKNIAATPTRVNDNTVMLANGETVKIPKRYCDKRKAERKIRDSYKAKPAKSIAKYVGESQTLIPIRLDSKTLVWVRISKCYKPKWIECVGSIEAMDKLINNILTNSIKLWQI